MWTYKTGIGLAAALALAGCQPGDGEFGPLDYSSFIRDAALAAGYVSDFSGYHGAAKTIRDSAQFRVQDFVWPGTEQHFSYDSHNVEYAHAVGLSGHLQIIAILDEGFRTTHDEFSGVTILRDPTLALPSSDHGTGVAAIAAGNDATGNMVGVAPDAALHLGFFGTSTDDYAFMTANTNHAASVGAIVQNNSWGFNNLDATSRDFNTAFSSTGGQDYIDALRNFSKSGIIVFAVDNDSDPDAPPRTRIDLMAGLPQVVPELEASFISVINAQPVFVGSDIVSANLFSAACFEAARYCMVADGTVYSATAVNNSDYQLWTGTSFAAPQVSGAIAILAEAFPSLTHQELRARLLASADNSFYTHTGYVQFTNSVKHGFNSTWGHGFLDLAAALLPIGGSYVPRAGGRSVDLDSAPILTSGIAGNAVGRALAEHSIAMVDGMGDPFDISAAALSAHGTAPADPAGFAADLMAGGDRNPAFGARVGQEYRMSSGTTELALLVPQAGSADQTTGASIDWALGHGWQVGLSGIWDDGSVLGIRSGTDEEAVSSLVAGARLGWRGDLAPGLSMDFGLSVGRAVADGELAFVDLDAASYDALDLRFETADLGRPGARLGLGIALPQAISGGTAQAELPIAVRSDGSVQFRTVGLELAPSARQVDLSIDYNLPMGDGAEMILSAQSSLNAGHVAGVREDTIGLGWRFSF